MTLSLSKTEIVNDNNEVVTSYLTIEEKIHVLQSLGEEWFSSIKNENDIYLQRGRILREIINEKLYKLKFNKETGIYEEIENRKFEDFLREDSKVFFKRHKKLSLDSANRYQAFYLLCNRMLSHANLSEPVLLGQITPMTHLILADLDKAEEVWKGALACKGEKEYPSPKDVQHAFILHGPKKAVTLRVQHQKDKFYNQPRFKRKEIEEAPVNTVEEPVFNEPQISFNELEKYEGSIDPAINCKIITSSCHQAKESLIGFKNILYNFIQENDTEALQQLKNIDVGVYSINNLDLKVKELEDLLAEIKLLLSK
jgi:hypothetical protein